MSNPEFDSPITWDELVWALGKVTAEDPRRGSHYTLPALAGDSAEHIATQVFRNIDTRREEAERWIAGWLYVSYPPGAATPWVYQRTSSGWIGVNNGEDYDDGDLDTSDFRLLSTGPPAGPGPMTPPVPRLEPGPDWPVPPTKVSQWVPGGLYVSGHPDHPEVFRRLDSGWWSYTARKKFSDGDQDTTGFRLLVPADLAHIHDDDGTVEGCPGCFPAPPRVRATEGDH